MVIRFDFTDEIDGSKGLRSSSCDASCTASSRDSDPLLGALVADEDDNDESTAGTVFFKLFCVFDADGTFVRDGVVTVAADFEGVLDLDATPEVAVALEGVVPRGAPLGVAAVLEGVMPRGVMAGGGAVFEGVIALAAPLFALDK